MAHLLLYCNSLSAMNGESGDCILLYSYVASLQTTKKVVRPVSNKCTAAKLPSSYGYWCLMVYRELLTRVTVSSF